MRATTGATADAKNDLGDAGKKAREAVEDVAKDAVGKAEKAGDV